ncbi:Plant self-incompatibility protein S1 family [Striga hermonthica]|uniref:S-protein homolog n=1 Tax=Striga hermonthica TaxID=68872 RepID=A0A9N7N2I0_STRHE|nr:Plant self-incompatibility protein S1 family [Striga hermonthica]
MTLNYVLLLSLLLHANYLQAHSCFLPTLRYHVYVYNNLSPSKEQLRVHCASQDDDLGYHNLTSNQNFHFTFCDNRFTTLFFCHLWWGKKNKSFEVFNTLWKKPPTHHSAYVAKNDGIYLSYNVPPQKLEKKFDWELGK